jgi:hypothetical protein
MVFDLVRPLGSPKKELEVNSLFKFQPQRRTRSFQSAPEVEYMLAEGIGIEFELPIEGRSLESLKFAAQTTLPRPDQSRFTHGAQGIYEVFTHERIEQVDMLYLAGVRFTPRWSTFTMTGARRMWNGRLRTGALANQALFFEPNRKLVLGLESNYAGKTLDPRSLLLMPQIHFRQGRYNIQAGTGALVTESRGSLAISWRISREF